MSWTHTGYAQRIVFGDGAVNQVTDVVRDVGGRRVLLITTKGRLASEAGEDLGLPERIRQRREAHDAEVARSLAVPARLVQALARLQPAVAQRLGANGVLESVGVHELQTGDCVVVSDGAIVPADGELTSVQCRVDESLLSGESKALVRPISKMRGVESHSA